MPRDLIDHSATENIFFLVLQSVALWNILYIVICHTPKHILYQPIFVLYLSYNPLVVKAEPASATPPLPPLGQTIVLNILLPPPLVLLA